MEVKCECGREAGPGILIGFIHGKFRCGYCIDKMINNVNKQMEQFYPHDNNTSDDKTEN